MNSPTRFRLVTLLALLAVALPASAQQPPPAVKAHPLYGNKASAAAVQAPVAASNDPRVLDLAERFKSTLQHVREANPAVPRAPQHETASVNALQQRTGGNVSIRMRHNTGTPRFIEAAQLQPAVAVASSATTTTSRDIATARNFLNANKELLRLADPDRELMLQEHKTDEVERRHLRFVQRHKGRRVWPAELGVHVDPTGSVYLMTGAYVPTPDVAMTEPKISADDAAIRARGHVPVITVDQTNAPELIVYAPGEQTPRLAWKVEFSNQLNEHWIVVVDAADGRILTGFNQICTANVNGSGIDLLGQTRPLSVWHENGTYSLTDTSKPMFDPTSQPPLIQNTRGGIVVVDAQNQPPSGDLGQLQQVFSITASSPNGFNLRESVSAAFNVSRSYDYFQAKFNRKSFDDKGRSILVIVRLGQGLKNAFFSPEGAVMGLGNGDLYAASLDVVGHEITHGVTGTSAGLVYKDQPGALNEAMSDIFGEMVEHRSVGTNDWILGSQLQDPFRNMANPGSKISFLGRPYPSKMTQYENITQDNGGVHVNSSIINRCFYLLTEGLQGGIGRLDAERIFYRALTVYLMQNSQFIDARLACIRAATDLFGASSTQAQRTAAAFDAVEIFDAGATPPPPDFPKVNAADSTLFLYGNQANGWLLARRESALNDPAEGRFLGNNFAAPRPPAVTGAGDIAVYVTADHDIALLRTDGQGESKLGFPGLVHAVGMSPDGNKFGFVLRGSNGQPDNQISVINIATDATATYELRAPVTDAGTAGTIAYADAMTFTADGRFLVYDALNFIRLGNGRQLTVFSIYALEIATGNINAVVSPLEGYNIGNPALSKTNDGFMVFEAVDVNTGQSTVLTSNLSTGNVTVVGASSTFAYPSYSGADDAIVYAEANPNTFTGISLVRRAVAQDRQTPVGERTLWLLDGGYPFIYRRGQFQGPPQQTATKLANISTRGVIGTGEDVLIGGFIVQGNVPKRVILRGIGPSLPVNGKLADPTLQLFKGQQSIALNDNWESHQRQEIIDTTVAPSNQKEAAIVASLAPGSYTVVMRGAGGGTGVGLVEIFDLNPAANSKLANISTRGRIGTDQNVLIGGFIVQGRQPRRVIVRAIGPSLPVNGKLQDPVIQLFSGPNQLRENNNWRVGGQEQQIIATTVPPSHNNESAVVATLVPGAYTVIARGAGGTSGVGLVEVYDLN